jgi:hypothetical protein
MHRHATALLLVLYAALGLPGCGGVGALQRIIQPPRFEQAPNHPAELRLVAPSAANPAGGAGVTLWLQVTNPTPVGFTLSHLDTVLLLEGTRAATGNFPLGLPLGAGQTSVVPIDLSISFADLPALGAIIQRAARGSAVGYDLQGTVGIDAGPLGRPVFGPLRLVTGELRIGLP